MPRPLRALARLLVALSLVCLLAVAATTLVRQAREASSASGAPGPAVSVPLDPAAASRVYRLSPPSEAQPDAAPVGGVVTTHPADYRLSPPNETDPESLEINGVHDPLSVAMTAINADAPPMTAHV